VAKVWFQLNNSLDGCAAGEDMSEKDPVGVGGMKLFEWQFALEAWNRMSGLYGGEVNASTPVLEQAMSDYGAVVTGATCSVAARVLGRRIHNGTVGGVKSPRTARRSSSSPITSANRCG
jgi:hypothetical protein